MIKEYSHERELMDENREHQATKSLFAYCPEIARIKKRWPNMLSCRDRNDLIAAALIRRIKERGEWEAFAEFLITTHYQERKCQICGSVDLMLDLTNWLTDPETFIRVVGEWVGREEVHE